MEKSSNWVYSEKVKEHFTHPKNILEDEENYQADGIGTVGNIKCGDQMMMAIKVDKNTETIKDCKWKTYGCASAIASTSILSEMAIGMTLNKASHISPKDVAKELNGLPDNKVHCSVLGDKALRAAINDYYKKTGQEDKIEEKPAITICHCMDVTDHDIEEAVLEGARTYLDVQERTKIGTVCGKCKDESISLMLSYIRKHFDK